jgi:hypothetical protein
MSGFSDLFCRALGLLATSFSLLCLCTVLLFHITCTRPPCPLLTESMLVSPMTVFSLPRFVANDGLFRFFPIIRSTCVNLDNHCPGPPTEVTELLALGGISPLVSLVASWYILLADDPFLLHHDSTNHQSPYPLHSQPFFTSMTTISAIKSLVKDIGALCTNLSDAVPKASKSDKIWTVMSSDECDIPHESFNRRFDALFGEDCRDTNGRLHYIRQGKFGMGIIVAYLSRINWAADFPLDLVELKLQRLITELKLLQ